MTKNGGLIYLGIKNEHINVCPSCGSTNIIKYSRNYKIIKTGLAYFHTTKKLRKYKFMCKKCHRGFNRLDNLQGFLEKKFNEARRLE